ncbi:MAG: hypothetical protein ACHQ5A_00005, partial [Opitutales bacterium]
VMIIPVFWINRQGIRDYYWVGQVTGAESAARLRGFDLWQSVLFVLGNLGRMHLGVWFGWTVAALTTLLIALFLGHSRKPATRFDSNWLYCGLAFLFLPAAVLIVHRQKSEVVLGVISPGIVLLVLLLWQFLIGRIEFGPARSWRRLLPTLPAFVAVGSGIAYFANCQLRTPDPGFLRDAHKVNQIADYIFKTSRTAHLVEPSVGIDRIVDFMDGRILRLICYERHKVWIPFGVHLPDSILAGPDEAVMFKLKCSDFMILTDYMPDHGYWPYDKQMRRLYPELNSWCQKNLVLVEHFSAFDREMSFYQRRGLR